MVLRSALSVNSLYTTCPLPKRAFLYLSEKVHFS
nr:MAG TPA: hypothetical protein [Caudoviricetes sp.]